MDVFENIIRFLEDLWDIESLKKHLEKEDKMYMFEYFIARRFGIEVL